MEAPHPQTRPDATDKDAADSSMHEKAGSSDIESSRMAASDYDDLPDPDAGKTDEERARLDRALVWKMDLWLIPWLSLLYLLSFLDRTNIGNARLVGLEKTLHMSSRDYSAALTIFFASYAPLEPLTNLLVKRVSPRIFFTVIMLIWGIVMALMGIVQNKQGLFAARFFLGVAEAGLFPGVNYYLSCWYKRQELGLRTALFFSAAAIAGSFGGLLAAAIGKMNRVGHYQGWRWIFIIEGIFTFFIGIFCWWMVMDFPETARFLTPDERLRAQRRLKADGQARATVGRADRRHVMVALKDWKTWGYSITFIGTTMPLYCFSLFLPTILAGMGFSGTQAQLLTVPPYAAAAAMTIIVGVIGDRTKLRGYLNIFSGLLAASGFAMLIGTQSVHAKYAGTFLGAMGIYSSVPNLLSWAANNVEGSLKRAVMLGIVLGTGNLNGIISSNIYMAKDKPRYYTGHGIVLAYIVIFLVCGSTIMHLLLERENKLRKQGKRDYLIQGKTADEMDIFGDQRPDFLYTI